eukprot:g4780.t1
MESDSSSYYAVLNVPREATEAEIRRAYKTLAQTFHPDKHSSESLREKAAHGFAQINEAYEVLVSPQKRQIYDIYGKQGLAAGMELGSKLKSVDELKAEWEKFKAERDMETQMSDITHDTHLQCTIDSSSLLDTNAPINIRKPEIESILIQSTLAKKLNNHHVGWIGGNVIQQSTDTGGGGNLLIGCRGMFDAKTGYSLDLQWGSKSGARLQTTQQITEQNQGLMSADYSPDRGLGLTFSSIQAFSELAQGTASVIMGPSEDAGVHLSVNQRTEKTSISTKVQVGGMYGLTGKVSHKINSTMTGRVIGRLGFNAIDLDLGINKQITPHSNVTLSVIYGIQGTYLKTKWRFGNFSLDLPIVLSRDPEDWKLAFIAVTLTPLSISFCRYLIVKPLMDAYFSRRALQERKRRSEDIKRLMETAKSSQQLLSSVAQRVTQTETLKSGLVIVKAQFGRFQDREISSIPSNPTPTTTNGDDVLPPTVMEVTKALQYLISNSQLELFANVPKSGLMGFCDLVPGETKSLRVWYFYQNKPYKVQVDDLEELKLPQQGQLISDVKEVDEVMKLARSLGIYPASSSVP